MLRRSIPLLALAAGLLMTPVLRAQEQEDAVRKLMKTMKSEEQLKQTKANMITQFRQLLQSLAGKLPEEKREKYNAMVHDQLGKLEQADASELIDESMKVYSKHYTAEEIKGLNDFFNSALGQKVMTTMPQVASELFSIGMRWNQEQTGKIMQDLMAAFPEMKGPPPGEAAGQQQ